jgi:mRNA interferase MazF
LKDFDSWNEQKKIIHEKDKNVLFKERDVWWCSIGLNIGHEEDGKGETFNRPVLIIKKFNKRLFWCIPLTTKVKDNKYYYSFDIKGRIQCAMLTHLRLYDASRLTSRMCQIQTEQFKIICAKLKKYIP